MIYDSFFLESRNLSCTPFPAAWDSLGELDAVDSQMLYKFGTGRFQAEEVQA